MTTPISLQESPSQSATSATQARAVIINVDDLGLSTAVNEAVIQLAERGRIGATSYMADGMISDGDTRRLSELGVDVGLHFDLTGLSKSPLKASLKSLIIASYLRHLEPAQVIEAIKQQLDAFEDCFNHAPVFVDGHQHVHQFPIIRQCLASELLSRYGDGSNNAICARVTTPLSNDVKSWIIYSLGGRAWRRLCQDAHIKTNDYFGGVYNFNASYTELVALWEQWLSHAPRKGATTLLMCHPAVPMGMWQDDIKAAREREYEWLMSGEFEALLEKHEVRLLKWSDIAHYK